MKKTLLTTFTITSFALASLNAQSYVWSIKGGNAGVDIDGGLAVDATGNSYSIASTTGAGAFGTVNYNANAGQKDILISKTNTLGVAEWAVTVGGANDDAGTDIGVDGAGNTYIIGNVGAGTATVGSINVTGPGMLFAKFNSTGVAQWAITVPVDMHELAVDNNGNCYLVGQITGTVNLGSTTVTSAGGSDVLVVKTDTDNQLIYAVTAGGSGNENAGATDGIACDNFGNAYITGLFTGSAAFGATNLTATTGAATGVYVAKLNPAGEFIWAKQATGTSQDYYGNGIAVSPDGKSVAATGSFNGSMTWGSTSAITATTYNPYIVSLDSAGTIYFAKSVASTSFIKGAGVTIDSNDKIAISAFATTPAVANYGSATLTATGSAIFVGSYLSSGALIFAKKADANGGFFYHDGGAIGSDANGNIYIAGRFNGTAEFDGYNKTSTGGQFDLFTAKIDPTATVGVNEISLNEHVYVYPNPSNGLVTIATTFSSTNNISVEVVDVAGKVVISQMLNKSLGINQTNLDFTNNAKGIYFLRVISGNQVVNKKLVIQ